MKHTVFYTILVSCLVLSASSHARKRDKTASPRQTELLAMITPDAMVSQPQPHAQVQPVEEARPHNIRFGAYRYGIDVSRYQGRIDWQAVKADGNAAYAYLKATEGASLVDNTYYYNLNEARKAGVKVGCYHFFSPTVSPEQQFSNFSGVVKLNEQDLIPIIDVELCGKGNINAFHDRLSRFLSMVEEHYGVQPIIYTSSNFYNRYLAGRYVEYKYMIARYKDEIPELSDDIKFVMWQFTANGTINGIKGPVDRSRFMEDYHLGDILLHP